MTKKVMNRASEMRMRFAGVVCSPSPARRKASATMMRVKLVTMMSSPGASDSTVRATMSCTMRAVTSPSGDLRASSRPGASCASAGAARSNRKTAASTAGAPVRLRRHLSLPCNAAAVLIPPPA